MSLKVTTLVWRAGLDATTKIVALRLADFADDDGGSIYPSVPRVARDCGLGERSVQGALRRLQNDGVLVMVREADFSRRLAREYAFNLAVLETMTVPDDDRRSTCTGAADAPVQEMHRRTTCTPPVQQMHPTGAPRAPQPSENPSVEPSEENHSVNRPDDLFGEAAGEPASDQRHEPDVDALFAGWWETVPKKVAKGAALRAYRAALKNATPDELLAGIRRYAAEVAGRDPQFTKHPATWLNGRCWLDDGRRRWAARRRGGPSSALPPRGARMTAVTFAASMHRRGRPLELKRRIGTSSNYVTCTVFGKAGNYQPMQLVGGVTQGDRHIRISQADITAANWPGPVPSGVQASQWPAKIKSGDILDNGTIQGAEPLYDAAELIGWACWVRGGG